MKTPIASMQVQGKNVQVNIFYDIINVRYHHQVMAKHVTYREVKKH